MLVCNVSLRPPRVGIAADIAEATTAADATATGNIVFATLVDDPANVGDLVDAYLGEIMLEAASADDAVSSGSELAGMIDETLTATDTPDAAVPTWTNTFSTTLSGNSPSWAGNLRQYLPAALISTSGTQVRITFRAGSSDAAHVGAAYIGHGASSGDVFDFDTTPVQITVGSATSWNVALGTTVVSDAIAFAVDETKNLIVSVFFDNSADDDVAQSNSVTGGASYFKSGANDAATVNATAYSNSSGTNACRFIERIEVLT